MNKEFPAGMEPLGDKQFSFQCHSGVSCYTKCCHNVDMFLYPYDIIRLKKNLGIRSDQFLQQYVNVISGPHPYFPSLMMKMVESDEKPCPFLGEEGCSVYPDRPASCRMYPLERAVDRTSQNGRPDEFYFLTNHPYCMGHKEKHQWKVKEWLRDQQLLYYNVMDDLWAVMDTFFSGNPWDGEGVAGPRQQLAFMVCYNIDGFRDYVKQHNLLAMFKMDKGRVRDIEKDDEALLKFGYDWLLFVLGGRPTLRERRR